MIFVVNIPKHLALYIYIYIFSCDEAVLGMVPFARPSARPSICRTFSLFSSHRIIMKFSGVITIDRSDVHAKGEGHRGQFSPIQAFVDPNSSLNRQMATKLCTQIEVLWKMCIVAFQCHPLNFKATRARISTILTRIGRFWTVPIFSIHRCLRNNAQSMKWHR